MILYCSTSLTNSRFSLRLFIPKFARKFSNMFICERERWCQSERCTLCCSEDHRKYAVLVSLGKEDPESERERIWHVVHEVDVASFCTSHQTGIQKAHCVLCDTRGIYSRSAFLRVWCDIKLPCKNCEASYRIDIVNQLRSASRPCIWPWRSRYIPANQWRSTLVNESHALLGWLPWVPRSMRGYW